MLFTFYLRMVCWIVNRLIFPLSKITSCLSIDGLDYIDLAHDHCFISCLLYHTITRLELFLPKQARFRLAASLVV